MDFTITTLKFSLYEFLSYFPLKGRERASSSGRRSGQTDGGIDMQWQESNPRSAGWDATMLTS